MLKNSLLSSVLALSCAGWFVYIFSGREQVHTGYYPTLERCEIAKKNLIDTFRAIGKKDVRGFCVIHNEYGR